MLDPNGPPYRPVKHRVIARGRIVTTTTKFLQCVYAVYTDCIVIAIFHYSNQHPPTKFHKQILQGLSQASPFIHQEVSEGAVIATLSLLLHNFL